MGRLTRVPLALLAVLSLLVVTACSGSGQAAGPPAGPGPGPSAGAGAAPPGAAPALGAMTHIHSAVRDPKDGSLLLATHEGLVRTGATGQTLVGTAMDLMAFTIAPDGTFFASGHPAAGGSLPQPLGLVASTDAGRTWAVLARGGQSDFHALAVSPTVVAAFDGVLWVGPDAAGLTPATMPDQPHTLAVTPGGRLLATTASGLLSSMDRGASWATVPTPALLLTVAVVDEATIVGATTDGVLVRTTDGGRTWTSGPRPVATVQAVSGSRIGQDVEILAVAGDGVVSTTDLGETTKRVA